MCGRSNSTRKIETLLGVGLEALFIYLIIYYFIFSILFLLNFFTLIPFFFFFFFFVVYMLFWVGKEGRLCCSESKMFRPQQFFAGISCPVREKCTLAYCLFSHDVALRNSPSPGFATTPALSSSTNLTREADVSGYTYSEKSINSRSTGEELRQLGDIKLSGLSSHDEGRVGSRAKRKKVELSEEELSDGVMYVDSRGTQPTTARKKMKMSKVETAEMTFGDSQSSGCTKEKGAQTGEGVYGVGKGMATPVALQKHHKLRQEQQQRMASVLGVQTAAGESQRLPQVQIGVGMSGPPAARSTSSSSSGSKAPATVSSLSPAQTYAKVAGKSGTINTLPAKPILLVPTSVPRCPTKWGTRVQLLTLLHTEYVRLYEVTPQDPMVITLAVDEEADIARTKSAVYPNVMKNRIAALKKADANSSEWVSKRKEVHGKRKEELSKDLREFARVQVAKEVVDTAGGKGRFGGAVGITGVGYREISGATEIANSSISTSNNPIPHTSSQLPSDLITDPALYTPLLTGLTPAVELIHLSSLVHPPAVLIKYGHILLPPSPTDVALSNSGVVASQGWEICDRCDSRFQIFPGRRESDGALASGGKCTYHWGRAVLPPRSQILGLGGGERVYTCCKEAIGASSGCVTADSHVFKVGDVKRLAGQWQWVHTYPDTPVSVTEERIAKPNVSKAFSLDCEMCYTTLGMELIRLTVVDFPNGGTVLDALVRPKGEILDLNTRFSGVSVKQYTSAKPYPSTTDTSGSMLPSPEAAREEVLQLLHSDRSRRDISSSWSGEGDHMGTAEDKDRNEVTVLIGHALENDMNVLRLCHPYIVDTCILFPHRRGFPMRNKLAWVAERHLKWRIQAQSLPPSGIDSEEALWMQGHDSSVDARCAGELVRWKIREIVKAGGIVAGVPGTSAGHKMRNGRLDGNTPISGRRYGSVAEVLAREREASEGYDNVSGTHISSGTTSLP